MSLWGGDKALVTTIQMNGESQEWTSNIFNIDLINMAFTFLFYKATRQQQAMDLMQSAVIFAYDTSHLDMLQSTAKE